MPTDPSSRNPLLWPLVGISVTAAQYIWDLLRTRNIDVFGVWSIAAAAALLVLYIRRSPAAGTFMFYSLLPIYPAYIVLTALGWHGQPARPVVYAILGLVWAVLSFFAWRWKRAYDFFISTAGRHSIPAAPA